MLVVPPPPTGLTVEVNESSVELNWNNASADIDFYRVEVYRMEGARPFVLHESLEKDTHEHVVCTALLGC